MSSERGGMVSESVVQGNVLRGFARQNAVYLFVRFDNNPDRVRPRLRELLRSIVTSAADQSAAPDKPLGMVGLSMTGYVRLGLEMAAPSEEALGSSVFRAGMRHSDESPASKYWWDLQIDSWEDGYREEIDAFLFLADNDAMRLTEAVREAKKALSEIAIIVAEEPGSTLRAAHREQWPVEHYGFREGLAKILNHERVFTQERLSDGSSGPSTGYGCFAAFLKLEQNVLRFLRESQNLARKINDCNGHTATAREIRELSLGRRFDGTPLAPQRSSDPDDFTFEGVSEEVCPYHAHVRAMNPRDGTAVPWILRRGMIYGPERKDLNEPNIRQLPPSAGSGLLFLSFQRSLYDFIGLMARGQKSLDPILVRSGAAGSTNGDKGQKWTIGGREVYYPMNDLTTIRGGAYFYVPSMLFIERLDQAPGSRSARTFVHSQRKSAYEA